MTSKQDFLERCDICKAIVIDKICNYSKYTKIDYKTFKIRFYCPNCIKKYKIKTDE